MLQRSAGTRLSETENSRLETVLRLTQRMDKLIEGLLKYSQVGRIDLAMQPMDLNEVVRGSLDLLRSRIEDGGAKVDVHTLPTVTCDRVRVREVFLNLILNALKFNDRRDKHVEVGWNGAPLPVFYVRDNGIGIAPEHREDIFRIFRRLHERDEYGGGTGAGLTIARRTVERHGGRMWVESELGQGSTFYFTLSATPIAVPEIAAAEMKP
jgi:light-regulated signal transduction histidine kinase (bacteriophytochrome)